LSLAVSGGEWTKGKALQALEHDQQQQEEEAWGGEGGVARCSSDIVGLDLMEAMLH
jgi:hypothetical protein